MKDKLRRQFCVIQLGASNLHPSHGETTQETHTEHCFGRSLLSLGGTTPASTFAFVCGTKGRERRSESSTFHRDPQAIQTLFFRQPRAAPIRTLHFCDLTKSFCESRSKGGVFDGRTQFSSGDPRSILDSTNWTCRNTLIKATGSTQEVQASNPRICTSATRTVQKHDSLVESHSQTQNTSHVMLCCTWDQHYRKLCLSDPQA